MPRYDADCLYCLSCCAQWCTQHAARGRCHAPTHIGDCQMTYCISGMVHQSQKLWVWQQHTVLHVCRAQIMPGTQLPSGMVTPLHGRATAGSRPLSSQSYSNSSSTRWLSIRAFAFCAVFRSGSCSTLPHCHAHDDDPKASLHDLISSIAYQELQSEQCDDLTMMHLCRGFCRSMLPFVYLPLPEQAPQLVLASCCCCCCCTSTLRALLPVLGSFCPPITDLGGVLTQHIQTAAGPLRMSLLLSICHSVVSFLPLESCIFALFMSVSSPQVCSTSFCPTSTCTTLC